MAASLGGTQHLLKVAVFRRIGLLDPGAAAAMGNAAETKEVRASWPQADQMNSWAGQWQCEPGVGIETGDVAGLLLLVAGLKQRPLMLPPRQREQPHNQPIQPRVEQELLSHMIVVIICGSRDGARRPRQTGARPGNPRTSMWDPRPRPRPREGELQRMPASFMSELPEPGAAQRLHPRRRSRRTSHDWAFLAFEKEQTHKEQATGKEIARHYT